MNRREQRKQRNRWGYVFPGFRRPRSLLHAAGAAFSLIGVDQWRFRVHPTFPFFGRDCYLFLHLPVALLVILTRDSILPYLGEVTVASITSTVRDIPSEVALSRDDGMRCACAINCDRLQTVSKGKIGALVTTLRPAKLAAVGRVVRFALDI